MEQRPSWKGACNTPQYSIYHERNIEQAGEDQPHIGSAARAVGGIAARGSQGIDAGRHGPGIESSALLRRAQAGDREAFAELYRSYVGQVSRYLTARVRGWNRDAVPDLVQDAFCEALADLPQAQADVRGWLMVHAAKAFTRHDCSWRRYTRAAYQQYHSNRESEVAAHNGPASVQRGDLLAALGQLPADQRTCLQLRFLEALPTDTVARVMERTPNAVKLLQRRALRRLRRNLCRDGPAGSASLACEE